MAAVNHHPAMSTPGDCDCLLHSLLEEIRRLEANGLHVLAAFPTTTPTLRRVLIAVIRNGPALFWLSRSDGWTNCYVAGSDVGFSILRQMVFGARICSCIFPNCCCWGMVWVRFDYIICMCNMKCPSGKKFWPRMSPQIFPTARSTPGFQRNFAPTGFYWSMTTGLKRRLTFFLRLWWFAKLIQWCTCVQYHLVMPTQHPTC